jgi:hypothetical protein
MSWSDRHIRTRASTAAFKRSLTHHMFALTLKRKYGERIFRAVSKELCLRPTPGEELSPRVEARAEQMAHTVQTVFSGMDFFTRMQLSPVLRPPALMQACIELGLRPSSLTQAECEAAQQQLDHAFETAAERHESPVALETGMAWLKNALRTVRDSRLAASPESVDAPQISPSDLDAAALNDPALTPDQSQPKHGDS